MPIDEQDEIPDRLINVTGPAFDVEILLSWHTLTTGERWGDVSAREAREMVRKADAVKVLFTGERHIPCRYRDLISDARTAAMLLCGAYSIRNGSQPAEEPLEPDLINWSFDKPGQAVFKKDGGE